MTTRTEVAADSPNVYFYFDETSGTFANHGSLGGSSVNVGNITYSQSAPSKVGQGTAVLFNPTSITNAAIGGGTLASGTTWTFETWVKRNTMTNPWVRIIGNFVNGSNAASATDYAEIAITDDSATAVTGSVRLWDNASSTSVSFNHATIGDLNWHHVAVVNNNGSVTIYVDGTSIGTGTMTCASKTGLFLVGTRSVAGTAFAVDEAAFTKTALSGARISAHAGNVGATVTPPAFTMSLVEPAPSLAGAIVDKTIAAPVMTLSIATPVANVSGSTNLALTNSAGLTGASGSFWNFGQGYSPVSYQFGNLTVPAGKHIASATLILQVNNTAAQAGAGHTMNYKIDRYAATFNSGSITTTHEVTGTLTVPASASTVSVDITQNVQDWVNGSTNAGIRIAWVTGGTAGSGEFIRLGDTGTVIAVDIQDIPPTPVIATPPAMTMSLADPVPAVAGQSNVTNAAGVATLSLTEIDATVSTTSNVNATPPAITGALSLPGGTPALPDFLATPGAIQIGAVTPSVGISLEYPAVVSVPAIYLGNMETEPAEVSLTTNRIAVIPAMKITLKWVGTYVESADRYLTKVAETTDSDDVWYKMGTDLTGATRAGDARGANQDGYYFGAPEFNLEGGPSLRKYVHFDGVEDYMVAGPYSTDGRGLYNLHNNLNANMTATVEFSIRTTQLNGTVFNARGGTDGAAAALSQTLFPYPKVDRRVVLKDGYLNIVSPTETIKVRTNFIADGEWHHVVIGLTSPSNDSGTDFDTRIPFHVTIDGQPALVRYGSLAGGTAYNWLPYAFMADADFKGEQVTPTGAGSGDAGPKPVYGDHVTGFLAGDLRDVIVRLNSYTDRALAQELYYEWSNSTIVQPDPMELSLAGVDPEKARGNTKRMLAIYGLPYGYTPVAQNGDEPLFTYMSALSGFLIQNFNDRGVAGWPHVVRQSSFNGADYYWTPKVFTAGGYTVYPVSIIGDGAGDHTGVTSASGVLSPDAVTQFGRFVDDTTGLPRFINLQDDLSEAVTEFDVVTVVNYPWTAPNGANIGETAPTVPAGFRQVGPEGVLYQHSMGLSNIEWEEARDNLRDSLLDASYNGVNLWIGEYHMAQHLGFIGQVDIHNSGSWLSVGPDNGPGPNDNVAGFNLDQAHLATGAGWQNWFTLGGYMSYPQVNTFRRIVAQVADLTDLPTNEITAMVEGYSDDVWRPNGSFLAYDMIHRPDGLQIGDVTLMPVTTKYLSAFDTTTNTNYSWDGSAPNKRWNIISARPDGIVGRVITREQETYYGPGGVVVSNPYKDNAFTIAVERGSVVRGRPIRGRAFIELMESGTSNTYIAEDLNKNQWQGNATTTPVSSWSFDTRRYKEVKISLTTIKWQLDGDSLMGIAKSLNYFNFEDGTYMRNLSQNWHGRGLNWLANAPETDGNDYIAYAAPMTVSLTTPSPAFSRTASPTIQVVGAMRLDMELRQPDNFKDGTVTERTLPMEISLEVRGIGASAQVPPMELTVSAVAPVIKAETELISVYLDGDSTINLFLKEDN